MHAPVLFRGEDMLTDWQIVAIAVDEFEWEEH